MNFHSDGFIYFHNWATFISPVLQTQTRFRLSLDLDLLIMFSESLGLLVPYSPVRISAYDGFGSLHCYQGMPLRVISGVLRIDPPHPLACHMRRWQRRHSCRVLRPVMVEDGIMVVEAYPKRLNIRNVRLDLNFSQISLPNMIYLFKIYFLQMVPSAYYFPFERVMSSVF